jgi:ribosomal protein S18 acetylase RimI-like enzyme
MDRMVVDVRAIEPGSRADAHLRAGLTRLLAELDPAHPPQPVNLERVLGDPSSRIVVALDGDHYVGMLSISFRTTLTQHVAYINHVAVDPDRRREGIGRRLVEHAVGIARDQGMTRVDLTSGSQREEAALMYETLGFTLRDTVPWRMPLH